MEVSTTSMNKIRVLIADGYTALREAWSSILNETEDIEVVGDAGDLTLACRLARETEPDVIVIDVNIPGIEGVENILSVTKDFGQSRVILITGFFNLVIIRKVMKAGIPGYLTKFANLEEFKSAIRIVGRGGVYLEESLREKMVYAEILDEKDPVEMLTNREMQVIGMIREGLNTREIAESLGLSFKTIEVHRHNIYCKLKVRNRVDLLNFFYQRGL